MAQRFNIHPANAQPRLLAQAARVLAEGGVVLDIEDLSDPTERSNERTDLSHWSASSANTRSARTRE